MITYSPEWLESPSCSQGPVCTREVHSIGKRLASIADGTNGLLLLLQIGITLQPVALHRNMYASVVEDMILKATEQLVSDILRQALAVGYQTASPNRIPKEITVSNIHQAVCNIPFLDFLTNKHMGRLNKDQ
ncbi:YEATS domain-containing protein 2-like [Arvicanthis niloticus]|uniref:YEATS domain-containing protein 2-like n=1 Tax=Arvicanthis niloticus TaxID=61156 RepID=UPI00402B8D3B